MNENEMKKIDEKSEEKVSGGIDKNKQKEILSKIKLKNILLAQGYGAVAMEPILQRDIFIKKIKAAKEAQKAKKPEEALAAAEPQSEIKK